MAHPPPEAPCRASELLSHAARWLDKAGIDDAEKEAELIVIHAAGMDRLALYRDDPLIRVAEKEKVLSMLKRREKREPLQYIIGKVEFRGLTIHVGPGVLIPRPETELLVEELMKFTSPPAPLSGKELRILDLCTGSGCLALAAAQALPGSRVTGTDVSETALSCARRNAEANGIENVTFLKGTLFAPVEGEDFDVILSNPPYVADAEMETLQPEIRLWEPREALEGGPDGLRFYREILTGAPGHLRGGGLVLLELGWGQAPAVAEIARASGFERTATAKDLCGIERVMVLRNIRSQR